MIYNKRRELWNQVPLNSNFNLIVFSVYDLVDLNLSDH